MYKGQGRPAHCPPNNRAIPMDGEAANFFHRGLRKRALPPLMERVSGAHAGLPGRGAEHAHVIVQQFIALLRARGATRGPPVY